MRAFANSLFLFLSLCGVISTASAAVTSADDLQNGLAVTQSETLKSLELKGFSLPALLARSASVGNLSNADLAKTREFSPVLENLQTEISAYKKQFPNIGSFFDTAYLKNQNARFALVGIINRLDRGYKTGNRCGEIRFIYRLAYSVIDYKKPVLSRLPMTINLIFNGGTATDDKYCQTYAQAWAKMTTASAPDAWISQGPLSSQFFKYENMQSLELNMQVSRAGAGAEGNFGGHADYLLKVYDWENGGFVESTLENQIDREALLKDPALMKEFKEWILDPRNAKAIDAGTLILPKKFLAKKAISTAPGGMARSSNRPYYNLFTAAELKTFSYADLENIKSSEGLSRRLNDTTCAGCHQTRAIGGFHFTGVDPFGKYPGNSVFLPGSAHFIGDLARRKAVNSEIASNAATVDYSRGFSARPQARRSQNLVGTGLYNGWGAHCSTGIDNSFKSWTCGAGLTCRQLLDKWDQSGMGICIDVQQKIGDPCEFGTVKNSGFGKDVFTRRPGDIYSEIPKTLCSPMSQEPGSFTGGFLNGNIRALTCQDGPGEKGLPPEANCGPLPAARPGFNACVGTKNFDDCLKEFAMGVGLRGCDQKNPCRDDYICAESFKPDRGVCVPPYFLFQFRVDGHPRGDL